MQAARGQPAVTVAARSTIVRWAHRLGVIAEALSLDGISAHLLYQPDAELPDRSMRLFQGFDQIVSFLAGPGEGVTDRLKAVRGGDVIAVDPRPRGSTKRNGVHITRQWAAELEQAGCPVSIEDAPAAVLSPGMKSECRARLASRLDVSAQRLALCHPGSGGLAKCCPIEALEEVVAGLQGRGWAVGWMIGPDELERFGHEYTGRLEISAPVIYEGSVERAADLACGADVYLGHDAGMTHVAAMGGVRTVSIFGPSDPRVWRPLGPCCRVVRFPEPDHSIKRWAGKVVAWARAG
jgi:hypothetical protein